MKPIQTISELDKALQELRKITDNLNIKELQEKYLKIANELGCSVEEAIWKELHKYIMEG